MGSFNPGSREPFHILAGEDLSNARYRAIKQVGGSAFIANEGDGESIWGVLQNSPHIGKSAAVVMDGFSPVLLGAACTENQNLGPDANGAFTPGATTAIVKAAEAGQAGALISAWIGHVGVVGGQTTANVEYTKITSTDPDETPRTAADWPGGIPPANARLDVQFLPLNRDRIELYLWDGNVFTLVSDQLQSIVVVAHGLDLTTQEGQRVPVAWFYDGTNSRPPAGIEEVNHFAVRAPNENMLSLRVVADMDGRTYSGCTNAVGGLGETMFWDATTKVHVQAPGDLRLFQVSDTDLELIKWEMEDTRSTVSAADSAVAVDEWVNQRLTHLLAGTEILNSSFATRGTTTGLPPLQAWTTDTTIEIFAGGVPCARFLFNDPPCVGFPTATGISFNRDLYVNDRVVVRRYRSQ